MDLEDLGWREKMLRKKVREREIWGRNLTGRSVNPVIFELYEIEI